MQNNVPTSDIDTQPPNPYVLDGIRPHNITQLFEPPRPTFASTLKLELESRGGDLKSTPEPKLGPQHGLFEPTRVVLKGDSSNPSGHTPPFVSSLQSKEPSASIAEFSACCILGKIWGETIPLSAIIHRTRNEWKFTKGQIDYVDLGND
uniref:Uncharacterized protein n=1 Tax=Opuntia streptacantha TaxID=393608 RepID=A0A7C9AS34_OPUST